MADIDDLSGRVLGGFTLGQRLDRGGFGTVYRAAQEALGRAAVVKVLHQRAIRSDVAAQRFAREALLSSQIDHPYAAHVYAFGVEHDGLVWIAMELVQGVTLRRWLAEHRCMPLEQFVPFFERLGEVVHVAHERGIVHRDLKSSNVMLIERAGQLLPKLLDFGVAALLDGVTLPHLADTEALILTDDTPRELAVATGADAVATVPLRRSPAASHRRGHPLTRASAAVGSPPYMAPEQWDGSDVAPAMDLYSLGVLAYEALTGRTPFVANTAPEYANLHRCAPVPSLGPELAALDRLFQRALAKLPADRFHSALEFAAALRFELESRMVARIRAAARQWHESGGLPALLWRDEVLADLERWIERSAKADTLGEIEFNFIEACRDWATEQFAAQERRTARRRLLRIVSAATAAAIVFGAFQIYTAYDANTARQIAAATAVQREIDDGRSALLHDELLDAQQHLAEAVRRGDHSAATLFMLARASQPLHAEEARFAARAGGMWSAAWSPDGKRIVTADDDAAQMWDVAERRLIATLPHGHGQSIHHAMFSADGATVITAGGDGTVRLWRADGAAIRVLRPRTGAPRYYLAATSADGRFVAGIDVPGKLTHVWDSGTGAVLAELASRGVDWPSLAFSADGRWLAAGGGDDVLVFDTRTWSRAATIAGPGIRAIAWDPAGPRLVTGSTGGDSSIWDVPSGARIRHLRDVGEPVDAVAWSPDGKLVAAASRDGAVQVWRAHAGQLQSQANQLHDKIITVEFDAGSRLLAAAGANGAVAISEAASGMPVTLLEGPTKLVRAAHFDPAGRRVLGASWDGTARIWDARPPYRRWSAPPISDDCGVDTAEPDRRFVAVPCRDRATQVWDTARGILLAELPSSDVLPVVSGAGDQAAIARGTAVELYGLPGGKLLRSVKHDTAVTAIAFGVGRDLLSGAADGLLLITRDGAEPLALPAAHSSIDAVAMLADGRALAADARGRIQVITGGTAIAEIEAPARLALLRPSPTGNRLVGIPASGAPIAPMMWDLTRYTAIARLEGHVGRVLAAHWVADDRLLTAGIDGAARMWDDRGQQLVVYRGSTRFVADATLSPDGNFVIGGGADGRLRFWEAATGRQLWTTPAHIGAVVGVHYEGEDLITRGLRGELARWHIPPK